jgi:osmotically-inducible protein OsmY
MRTRASVLASTNAMGAGAVKIDRATELADRETTRKILTALFHADPDHLGAYQKASVITANGKVTLQGTLKGAKLKDTLHKAAESVVGATNLTDNLIVKK